MDTLLFTQVQLLTKVATGMSVDPSLTRVEECINSNALNTPCALLNASNTSGVYCNVSDAFDNFPI